MSPNTNPVDPRNPQPVKAAQASPLRTRAVTPSSFPTARFIGGFFGEGYSPLGLLDAATRAESDTGVGRAIGGAARNFAAGAGWTDDAPPDPAPTAGAGASASAPSITPKDSQPALSGSSPVEGLGAGTMRWNTGGPNGTPSEVYVSHGAGGVPVFSSTPGFAQRMSDGTPLTEGTLDHMMPGIQGGQTQFEGAPGQAESNFGLQYAPGDPRGHEAYAAPTAIGAPPGMSLTPQQASIAGGAYSALGDATHVIPSEERLADTLTASQLSAQAGPLGLRRVAFAPTGGAPGTAGAAPGSAGRALVDAGAGVAAGAPVIPVPTTPVQAANMYSELAEGAARNTEARAQQTRANAQRLKTYNDELAMFDKAPYVDASGNLTPAGVEQQGRIALQMLDDAGLQHMTPQQIQDFTNTPHGAQLVSLLNSLISRASYQGSSWWNKTRFSTEGRAALGSTINDIQWGPHGEPVAINYMGDDGSTPWTGHFNSAPFPMTPEQAQELRALAYVTGRTQAPTGSLRRTP